MLAFIGGGDLTTEKLLRQCDIFRANIPFVSERVCLSGEFALSASGSVDLSKLTVLKTLRVLRLFKLAR